MEEINRIEINIEIQKTICIYIYIYISHGSLKKYKHISNSNAYSI